jgi:hypothetical protein
MFLRIDLPMVQQITEFRSLQLFRGTVIDAYLFRCEPLNPCDVYFESEECLQGDLPDRTVYHNRFFVRRPFSFKHCVLSRFGLLSACCSYRLPT